MSIQYYLFQQDNAVHTVLLESLKQDKQMVRCEGNAKKLNKYRYAPLQANPSLLIISNLTLNEGTKKAILQISLKNRLVVFHTRNAKEVEFLKKITPLQDSMEIAKSYKSWKEKQEICQTLLNELSFSFKNSKVLNQCTKLIVRDFANLPYYVQDLKIIAQQAGEITEDHLKEVFDNTEIHSLGEWSMHFLMGKGPRSSIQKLHYFLHTKQYSSEWVCKFLYTQCQRLTYFYDAQVKGVFYNEKVSDNFMQRATILNVPYLTELKQMRTSERLLYAQFVGQVSFTHFFQIQQVLYREPLKSEVDLYQTFLSLQALAQTHKKDEVSVWRKNGT